MISFLFFWVLVCLFSFAKQDFNLTLYNWTVWNSFRTWLQFLPSLTQAAIFLLLISVLFYLYFKLLKYKVSLEIFIFLIVTGVLAYPLFSYDIFNYLFNAKMVLIYRANPHIQVALNFPWDIMLRFMHNVHTPAPYAYGWTVISLLPGLIWFTKNFTFSFWAMKGFVALFWLGQLWILSKLVKRLFPQELWRWGLFALNPLVLVETLINGHNDVVMLFLALFGYWFWLNSQKFKAGLFLLLSASIKYATVVLLPFIWLRKRLDLPAIFSFLLLGVMFTRPDQLHSWYLIWAFSFAVLARSRWLVSLVTALTLGALFRYLPFLYFTNWDPPVYLYRNLIWLGSLLLTPLIKRKMIK